jgi:cytidine deaminase
VQLAHENRLKVARLPAQSLFRVYALMICEDVSTGALCAVEGHNHESGYIGGSICAERSAIGSAAFRNLTRPLIRHVVISTDSTECIAPGCLCREYMSSFSNANTQVTMISEDMSKVVTCPLSQLYSAPYAYGKLDRLNIEPFARALAARVSVASASAGDSDCVGAGALVDDGHPSFTELCAAAKAAALTLDSDAQSGANLHPVCFGAALECSDGRRFVAGMLKGVEYGCTLDPVTALLAQVVQHRAACPGVRLVALVMMDQFGIAHAPFAQARALLSEHGCGSAAVAYHEPDGRLGHTTAAALIPPITQPDDTGHSGVLSFRHAGFVNRANSPALTSC